MAAPIDPMTAKLLADSGLMNPQTYESHFSNVATPVPAVPQLPDATANPMAPSVADENLASARTFADQRASEDFVRKRDFAKAAGLSDEELKKADWWMDGPTLDLTGEEFLAPSPGPELATQQAGQNAAIPMGGLAGDQQTGATAAYGLNTAGYDLYQRALAEGGVIGAQKASEESSYLAEMQKNMASIEASNEKFRVMEQEQLEKAQNDLNDEINRVSGMKIDSSRMWSDMGNGNRVTAGIALALGAFGAARTGVNQAARTINAAIDRDIRAQQADIANERSGLSQKNGLLSQMRQRFSDETMARQATKIAYLNNAQIGMQEIAAKYQGKEAANKATQLIAQVEVQKEKLNQEFMAKMKASMPVSPNADIASVPADLREYWVPGYGPALTKDGARQANKDLIPTMTNVKGNIDELLKLANTDWSSIDQTDRARANTIATMLIGQLRLPIVGPGAVSEKELELLETIIADPTRIFSLDDNNKERLQTLRERIDVQTYNQLKQLGIANPKDRLGYKRNEG